MKSIVNLRHSNSTNKNKTRRNTVHQLRQSSNLRYKWRPALSFLLICALVVTPLTTFDWVVAQAQGCFSTSPDRIFQQCPLGGREVEQALEDQAINDVLALYQLAPSERSRLLSHGRNLIRGMLFARLLELIKKQAPTTSEQQALASFANRIKQKRIDAATFALEEYLRWKDSPCTYNPPAPFDYDPGSACGSPLANLYLGGPLPPTFEEFQQMGAVRAYGDLNSSAAKQAAAESSRAAVVAGGAAAVGLGALVGAAIGSVLPPVVINVIFPFALRTAFIAGVEVSSTFSGASVFAGPAAIVVAALVVLITRTIDVVNASQIQGKLEAAKTEAQNSTINLRQLIADEKGLQEFYGAFILATLPDFSDSSVPPPSANDRRFLVRQNGSSTTTDSPTISYRDWDGNCHTARQSGAWFVDRDQNGVEKLTISIDYLDWNNDKITASRSGLQFILTKEGVPQATRQVDELQYKDCTGTQTSARIKFEQLTVTGNPLVTVGCPLDPNSAQAVVIGSVAGSGDPPASLFVTVNDQASATVNGITVRDLAVNSQYQITANVFVPANTPVKADFTVKVRNTINQTSSAPFTVRKTAIATSLPDAIPSSVDVGSPYYAQIRPDIFVISCGQGGSTISITDGTLPNGLSLQPEGTVGLAIKGTPTAGGLYRFTVTETIGNGESQSRTYTILVRNNLAELPSGMVSWWRGEGNTNDFTGLHNGSLFGSAGFADGIVNTAFKFNGTNGYVALPNDTFEPSLDFSYELWFKTSTKGVILGRQRGVAPYNRPLQGTRAPIYVGSDGKLRARMFGGDGETFVISPNRVDDNFFHHVAVVYYRQAQTEQVYLDGNLIGTISSLNQGSDPNFIYQFGTGYVSDSNLNMFGWFNFNGLVDEPTLYNRPLAENEIRAIYTAGGAGKISVNVILVPPTSHNGTNGSITVLARGGTPPLRFSKDNGATFQETNTFHNLSPSNYTVIIKDGADRIYTRTVTIDNPPPTLSLTSSFSHPTCAYTQTGRITLYATGTTGPPQYSVLNGANAQSSNVFEGLSAGTYTPWVRDPSGTTVTGQQIVLTNPPELTLSPATIPDATVGQPYSQTFTSNGGTGARTMTATNLPAGFTATSTASGVTVSGTPQQAGTLTFFVRVDDANACFTGRNVNLTVTDNCPAMTLEPAALPVGTAGQAFPATAITPTSGAAPFNFTITGLPSGMTSTATATELTISGTPAQAGLYQVQVTATSANNCTRSINYQLVINRAGNPSGLVLISEVRTSGPNGPDDEFVELYNNTDSPIDLQGWTLVKQGFTCNSSPQVVATITQNTIIPARGHYLVTGAAYSLGAAAASNNTLINGGLEDNVNLALFVTNVQSQFNPNTRQDAVAIGTNTGNYCDLLREGTNLPSTAGSTSEHSYVRKVKVASGAGTGRPLDTNDNATDFALVSTTPMAPVGSTTSPMLGAPGPENLASPVQRNSQIRATLLDPAQGPAATTNRRRYSCTDTDRPANCDPNTAPLGYLSIRRTYTNNTGQPVTRLRFRVVDISTTPEGTGPGGNNIADVRALSRSGSFSVTPLAGAPITVQGLTVEQQPNQPLGGGFNASLAAPTITLQTPLSATAPNNKITVEFLLGIVQGGNFRFLVNVEAQP